MTNMNSGTSMAAPHVTGVCAPVWTDVDQDFVPDQCETDCNSNGVPDDYEVELALGTDLNLDGQLDECEDANDNGIPDDREVDDWPTPSGNGIPDSIDILEEPLDDDNENGVPDEIEVSAAGGAIIDQMPAEVFQFAITLKFGAASDPPYIMDDFELCAEAALVGATVQYLAYPGALTENISFSLRIVESPETVDMTIAMAMPGVLSESEPGLVYFEFESPVVLEAGTWWVEIGIVPEEGYGAEYVNDFILGLHNATFPNGQAALGGLEAPFSVLNADLALRLRFDTDLNNDNEPDECE